MDRRIIKTKEAIKTAYTQLLKEKLSSKITVTEIAKRANIDRKTFYLHFDSPDAIMDELLEDNLTELNVMLSERTSGDASMDVATLFHCINACIMKNIDFYDSIASQSNFEILAMHAKNIIIQKNVESLLQTTTLSPEEVRIYTKFIISGLIDIYVDWLRNKIPLSLDEVGNLTANVVEQGIRVLSTSS